MIVHVLGQLNIDGVEVYVYKLPNSPTSSEGLYFSHIDIMPFMFLSESGLEYALSVPEGMCMVESTKDLNTKHIFIKAEIFAKMSELEIFSDPNWTDHIHPILLEL